LGILAVVSFFSHRFGKQAGCPTPASGQRLGFDTAKDHRLLNHQPLLGGRGLPAKAQSILASLASLAAAAAPYVTPPVENRDLGPGVLREASPLGV